MNNKDFPYMDMHTALEPKFIICKLVEAEKRISGLEYRLKMLEKKEGDNSAEN